MAGRETDAVRVSVRTEAARAFRAQDPAVGRADTADPAGGRVFDTGVADPVVSLDLEDLGLDITVSKEHLASIVEQRLASITQVYSTLDVMAKDLTDFFPKVPEITSRRDPRTSGQPGRHGCGERLGQGPRADRARRGRRDPASLADPRDTDRPARRLLAQAPPRPIGDTGMTLLVSGSNRMLEVAIRRADLIAGNGALGVVALDQIVEPLPRSIVSQLGDVVVPTSEDDLLENPQEFAQPAAVITLGDDDCARSFRSNIGIIDTVPLLDAHPLDRRRN